MIILGIDPGLANVGFGVVSSEGGQCRLIEYGAIVSNAKLPKVERLFRIHKDVIDIIERYKPDAVVTEQLLFSVNKKSAMEVSQAIGVILLAVAQSNIAWQEYSPMKVKMALVGYGGAEKQQVQFMVQKILGLKEPPKPDHASDALAVSICHAHSVRLGSLGIRT